MRSFISILAVSALVVSCGGSNVSPLTSEQRSEFGATLESTGRAQRAGQGLRTGGATRLELAATSDAAEQQMTQKLKDAHHARKCTVEFPEAVPNNSNPENFKARVFLKVSGAQCPIALNLDMNMEMTANQQQQQVTMKLLMDMGYAVKDTEFAKLNDVTGFEMKGAFNATISQQSASGSGEIKGAFQSQKYGSLPVSSKYSMSGNRDKVSIEMVTTVKYPTYNVELRLAATIEGNGKTTEDYTLNGEKLTKQQAKELLSKSGNILPGGEMAGQGSNSQPSNSFFSLIR